jgi:hypothetical protein
MGLMSLPVLFTGKKTRLVRTSHNTWEEEKDGGVAVVTSDESQPKLEAVVVKMRRFYVMRSPKDPSDDIAGVDELPWFVQELTNNDDTDDYGRMPTWEGACALIGRMMLGERFGAE